ncbi:MAG: acyl carrier protein [Bacteroidota bacterium]|jgi:acyl carrier protein|nr:acyl carrier protein [Bacteroidota bacterium]
MTLEEFTVSLEKELEEVAPGTLTPDTVYRELKNWSSMYALIIIAFIDFNFNIILNSKELKETTTVRELYNLVKSKSV